MIENQLERIAVALETIADALAKAPAPKVAEAPKPAPAPEEPKKPVEVVKEEPAPKPAPKPPAKPKPKLAPKPPAPAPVEAAEDEPHMTPEEVNERLIAVYHKLKLNNREPIDKVIRTFGVYSLRDLDPKYNRKLVEMVEALTPEDVANG